MVQKKGVSSTRGILLVCLTAFAVVLGSCVWGVEKPKAAEGQVNFNVNASMADNLKTFVGKKVYVTLDSGKTLAGSVKAVGGQLLHLEKIEGKEFFDALIRIENIGAIDTRFRGEQR